MNTAFAIVIVAGIFCTSSKIQSVPPFLFTCIYLYLWYTKSGPPRYKRTYVYPQIKVGQAVWCRKADQWSYTMPESQAAGRGPDYLEGLLTYCSGETRAQLTNFTTKLILYGI